MAKRLEGKRKMGKHNTRPQITPGMDRETKKYFNGGLNAFAARTDKTLRERQDLSRAFSGTHGRLLRRHLARQGIIPEFGHTSQGMERAIGVAVLWLEWAAETRGSVPVLSKLPAHVLPVRGPVEMPNLELPL